MSIPPKFHGKPSQKLTVWVYQLSSSPALRSAKDDRQKIISASTLLAGEPLEWFLSLLKQNAQEYVFEETLRRVSLDRSAVGPPVRFREWDSFSWTEFPFVVEQLASWDGFLKSLWDKFGPPKVEEFEESRAGTPLSTSTVDLLSAKPDWPKPPSAQLKKQKKKQKASAS